MDNEASQTGSRHDWDWDDAYVGDGSERLEAIRIESVATKPHDHGDHGSTPNQGELRMVIAVARRPVS